MAKITATEDRVRRLKAAMELGGLEGLTRLISIVGEGQGWHSDRNECLANDVAKRLYEGEVG